MPELTIHSVTSSLELESFQLASRLGPCIAREDFLAGRESDGDQPGQKAMHQLMELVRCAHRDPQQEEKAAGR